MLKPKPTAPPDYSAWMTKQQAADMLDVSTKQIERWANEGQLQSAKYRRPSGGPKITVYHPNDVAQIANRRNPGAPFVLPRETPGKPNPLVAMLRPAEKSSPNQQQQGLVALVAEMSRLSQSRPRLAEQLYLTLSEASGYSGLGIGYLRRLIAAGKLELLKAAGPHGADVLRRAELEKLKL